MDFQKDLADFRWLKLILKFRETGSFQTNNVVVVKPL